MASFSVVEGLARTADDAHPPLYYATLAAWIRVAGDSPFAIRFPSVILNCAAIALTALSVREAAQGATLDSGHTGWLVTLALGIVSATHIVPAVAVRMYALGGFLCALSTWLLLRATRGEESRSFWWVAYGLSLAAFAATHHYALFSAAGQVAYILGIAAAIARAGGVGAAARWLTGPTLAGLVAALAYLPLVPTTLGQVRAVGEQFWISPATFARLERMFVAWLLDADFVAAAWRSAVVILISAFILVALLRGVRAAWLFALPAFTPWAAALAYASASGRPILLERYLLFAHVSLLGLWGVTFDALPGRALKFAFAWLLGTTTVYGLAVYLARATAEPPVELVAFHALEHRLRPDDWFALADYRELNRVRYYAKRAGLPRLRLVARVPELGHGHVTHQATLTPDEMFASLSDVMHAAPGRVWLFARDDENAHAPSTNKVEAYRVTFRSAGASLTARLYE